MEVSTSRLTLAWGGTVSGRMVAARSLEKPTSEGTLGDDRIVSTALTALILVAELPPTASTTIVTVIGTLRSPFGQITTAVPKRAPVKRASAPEEPPTVERATTPAAAPAVPNRMRGSFDEPPLGFASAFSLAARAATSAANSRRASAKAPRTLGEYRSEGRTSLGSRARARRKRSLAAVR